MVTGQRWLGGRQWRVITSLMLPNAYPCRHVSNAVDLGRGVEQVVHFVRVVVEVVELALVSGAEVQLPAGNVWEWQSDWFSPNYHKAGPQKNPTGPRAGVSRSIRGGSYLCHDSYCNRYRVAARSSNTADSSTGNLGFRCVMDA